MFNKNSPSLSLLQESGNVHLAPGEQLRHSGSLNVADLVMFTFMQFNISHEIHSISFGPQIPVSGGGLGREGRERSHTGSSPSGSNDDDDDGGGGGGGIG